MLLGWALLTYLLRLKNSVGQKIGKSFPVFQFQVSELRTVFHHIRRSQLGSHWRSVTLNQKWCKLWMVQMVFCCKLSTRYVCWWMTALDIYRFTRKHCGSRNKPVIIIESTSSKKLSETTAMIHYVWQSTDSPQTCGGCLSFVAQLENTSVLTC